MPRSGRALQVHKFGGASLADGAAIRHAAAIILRHRPAPTIVVASAMAGVTDLLLAVATEAAAGEAAATPALLAALRARHTKAARALVPSGPARRALLQELEAFARELETLLEGLRLVRELTARTSDYVVARGERMSARLMTAALGRAGVRAHYVDAVSVVRTDGEFGRAAPDLAATDGAARAALRPLLARGIVPVVPGFLGAAPSGEVVTLGRGGSDLTATLLARALGADRVTLWKDVPGLLTADPRVVADAQVIAQLNVREAAELAYYGAKVLHPRALTPLAGRQIPLYVRPFADAAAPGTEVSERRPRTRLPVRALSAVGGQALVTVSGNGMLGVPGIAERTFRALHAESISVALISQASSEHSICFTVPAPSAELARRALLAEFAGEIVRREIDGVELQPGVATLAVVGLGMAGAPGVAARVFGALAESSINIVAIAQGSSELNISLVVAEGDTAVAQRRIHDAFWLGKIGGGVVRPRERTSVVLLGFGRIGRALTAMVGRLPAGGRTPSISGVIDRSGYLLDADGLSPKRLAALAAWKKAGRTLAEAKGGVPADPAAAIDAIARHALVRPILVDLTADATLPLLTWALGVGMDLVLANKRPLVEHAREDLALLAAVERAGRRIRYEATVGAGLPIIATSRALLDTGDRIARIEACLSGTLGFLLTELERGRPFSEAVRAARAAGYTEPDPREDLAGVDVARKAVILARLLGYPHGINGARPESLVAAADRRLPLERFLEGLERRDAAWAQRVAEAHATGGVLRYVASATARRVSVGLSTVPRSHPFASLTGTDNQIVFHTTRYRSSPLVVTGPGAGVDVTAGGVLADLIALLPA